MIMQQTETHKFVTFNVSDYRLALPIEQVLRVIKCAPESNPALSRMNLVQIGRHIIGVLDLQRQFSPVSTTSRSAQFLMVIQGGAHSLCGIPVHQPPDVVELPLALLRSLPSSSAPSPLLDIVSHAAVLDSDGEPETLFVLNVPQALSLSHRHEATPALKAS